MSNDNCKDCEKINSIKEDIKELKVENKEIKNEINELKRESTETKVYYKIILEKIDELNNGLKMFEKNLSKLRDEKEQGWQIVGSIAKDTTKAIITISLSGGVVGIVLKLAGII